MQKVVGSNPISRFAEARPRKRWSVVIRASLEAGSCLSSPGSTSRPLLDGLVRVRHKLEARDGRLIVDADQPEIRQALVHANLELVDDPAPLPR